MRVCLCGKRESEVRLEEEERRERERRTHLEELIRAPSRQVPVVQLGVEEVVAHGERLVVGVRAHAVGVLGRSCTPAARRLVERGVHRLERVEHEPVARLALREGRRPRVVRGLLVEPERDGAVGRVPLVRTGEGEVDDACR